MNDLKRFFRQHHGRLIHKWLHYFEIYDRHFARFRGGPVNILEFGVSQGGSLQMWRDYFGQQAQLFGVDINPNCKQFEEAGVRIFIGDQQDRAFLRSLARALPRIDILIDDGGHTMKQQIATFEELFPLIAPNGVYLCEDLHTSYWRRWGGGYRRRGTFIEYSKRFIDALNAWHSRQPGRLAVSEFTRSAHSLHYYDSVLVVEKRPMTAPADERKGQALFPDHAEPARVAWLRRLFGPGR
ncbi:MAG: class I SAM-dependent methyltransferase [Pseudomonadota bacterium]